MNSQRIINTAAIALLITGLSGPLNAAVSITDIDDPNNDSTPTGGGSYEIYGMDVTWDSSDNITVDVHTNFAGVAGSDSAVAGNWYIRYGDLLIGTNPNFDGYGNDMGTTWDYAFMLDTDDIGGYDRRSPNADNPQDGYLVEFSTAGDGKNKASDWHSSGAGKPNEIVTSSYDAAINPIKGTGSWSVADGDPGVVSFSFDIGALNLQDPAQLAFRWAMTCANDIVSGVAYAPGDSNGVPEPTVLALMLAGLAGVGFTKKRRKHQLAA